MNTYPVIENIFQDTFLGSAWYHVAVAEWSQSKTPIASLESKELPLAKSPVQRTRDSTLLGSYNLDEHRRLYIPGNAFPPFLFIPAEQVIFISKLWLAIRSMPHLADSSLGSPPHLPPSIGQKEFKLDSDPNFSNAVIPRAEDAVCPAIQITSPHIDLASLQFLAEPSLLAELLLGRSKPLLVFGSEGMPTLLGRLIKPPRHDSTGTVETHPVETASVEPDPVERNSFCGNRSNEYRLCGNGFRGSRSYESRLCGNGFRGRRKHRRDFIQGLQPWRRQTSI